MSVGPVGWSMRGLACGRTDADAVAIDSRREAVGTGPLPPGDAVAELGAVRVPDGATGA